MGDSRWEDEAALVAGLKARDRDAFRHAVERYSGRLLAVARAIAGPAQAEDVVQETWLTVFQRIDGFEERAALATWLQRIVTNRAISVTRSRSREVLQADGEAAAPDADWFDDRGHWERTPPRWEFGSPDALLAADDLEDCIDQHLLLMPDNQRRLVVLRDMQQRSFDEICNELGLSASNARVLLHRGRVRLMRMVDRFRETGAC
jgi:RNA polymerase sigma-70 factor (ECF subfamily)